MDGVHKGSQSGESFNHQRKRKKERQSHGVAHVPFNRGSVGGCDSLVLVLVVILFLLSEL